MRDLRTCGTCDGNGEVRPRNGTGQRWSCPHCGGSGKVRREADSAKDTEITRLESSLAAERGKVRGLEGALQIIDNNRGAETEDAYVLYRKLVNSANIARAALTPPAPQAQKGGGQ